MVNHDNEGFARKVESQTSQNKGVKNRLNLVKKLKKGLKLNEFENFQKSYTSRPGQVVSTDSDAMPRAGLLYVFRSGYLI